MKATQGVTFHGINCFNLENAHTSEEKTQNVIGKGAKALYE